MGYETSTLPAPRQAEKWSDDEINQLANLARRQWRARIIAAHLGRTEAGVRGKAASCGIALISDRMPAPVTLKRWARSVDCRPFQGQRRDHGKTDLDQGG